MKVYTINRLGAVIGIILMSITLVSSLIGFIPIRGETESLNSEKVDLNIYNLFSLSNTSSIEFDRTFSLTEKYDRFLLHIKCRATDNTVNNVLINVTINGVETSEVFEDSNYESSSPHTFFIGTTITLQIDPSTPIYVLTNSLKLGISVDSSSLFNSNKGDFLIEEVIFESFLPPTITSNSKTVPVSLQVSEGVWYISPLTILKERGLKSEIFAHIAEDVRARIDISISPLTYPLSSIDFSLTTSHSSFEAESSSAGYTINADLIKEDILKLNFKFRPSTELTTDIINLSIELTMTIIPPISNNNSPEDTSELDLAIVSLSILETVRLLMILAPLFILYIRRPNKKISKDPVITKNLS